MHDATLPSRHRLSVGWARHGDEVREAQRLRFDVFARELGAQLPTSVPLHDVDCYDDFCEHLLVRDGESGEVIGTYRALTPAQARRAGSSYADGEFDLTPLASLRPRMLELGRSCVHPAHRHGRVMLALWSALAEFMTEHDLDTMMGCASVPLHANPSAAAGVWNRLRQTHLSAPHCRIAPRRPLPIPGDGQLKSLDVEPPALVSSYLRLGARVLGPPAWDPIFNCADLPLLVRMEDLPARYRRAVANA